MFVQNPARRHSCKAMKERHPQVRQQAPKDSCMVYKDKHLDVWMLLILQKVEHFKEFLNISSTPIKQALQYFITTNCFSLRFSLNCLDTLLTST